jgi:DnaJ-class molecular chaperone
LISWNILSTRYLWIFFSFSTTVNMPSQCLQSSTELDKYHICKSCMGSGTLKVFYNKHMIVEKECDECSGESIIRKPDR